MSLIQIKFSEVTVAPASLAQGELAYSAASGNLYIGSSSGIPVVVGGADLIARFSTVEVLVGAIRAELTQSEADIDSVEAAVAAVLVRLATLDAASLAHEGRLATLDAASFDHEGRIVTNTARINSIDTAYQAGDAALSVRVDAVVADAGQLRTEVVAGINDRVVVLERTQGEQDQTMSSIDSTLTGVVNVLNGGDPTFGHLTVTGKLTVNGTMSSINSEVTTIKDPVISLGDATLATIDGMDRGVEFKHFDTVSGEIKTGFFGMDSTDKKFKFIPDAATGSGDNVYDGDTGIIVGNIEGTASSLAVGRNITLGGDASGNALFDGSSDVAITVAVSGASAANAETLVRRDVNGSAEFTAIKTTALVNMSGGIDGSNAAGTPSELSGFYINGGTF